MDPMPGKSVSADAFEKKIALPPIPHLESMPWMKENAGQNAMKINTLTPGAVRWAQAGPPQLAAQSVGS